MSDVFSWWYLLCAVAFVNVAAWALSATAVTRRRAVMSLETGIACRRQCVLAAVYVFGCAFRSALPVFDIPRLALFDTWWSSVVVGRSVATIAELCFVAQWALLLQQASRVTQSPLTRGVSFLIVPLIAVAEICSWYSVLTTSNLGHVVEESIWGLSALLTVAGLVSFHRRWPPSWRPMLIAAVVAGIAYAAYMFLVDVPMYWSRWLADEADGRQYFGIAQGLLDTSARRVVSHRWEDWKSEMVWMSLYFSVAVWISISLIHASARRPTAQRS
jgi:hypothetical protein